MTLLPNTHGGPYKKQKMVIFARLRVILTFRAEALQTLGRSVMSLPDPPAPQIYGVVSAGLLGQN